MWVFASVTAFDSIHIWYLGVMVLNDLYRNDLQLDTNAVRQGQPIRHLQ